MSTIKAILEAKADGTLHLPVLPELHNGKIKVEATLERAAEPNGKPHFGCLGGKISVAKDFDEPLEDFKDYM